MMSTLFTLHETSFKSLVLLMSGFMKVSQAALDMQSPDLPSSFRDIFETGLLSSKIEVQYCGKVGDDTIHTTGDVEVGPGFWITNSDGVKGDYFVYENSRDDHPWKYITLDNGTRAFVQVCPTWQGHIIRGVPAVNLDERVQNLGTWAMASVDSNGAMWGGISFLQGSDGGGSVSSTDGSAQRHSCSVDVLATAPEVALSTKGSGTRILSKVVGEGASMQAMNWMLSRCSSDEIYILENGANPVVKSANGRLEWVFFDGKF